MNKIVRWLMAAGCAIPLLGCSLASAISGDTQDYEEVVENVTDTMLVTNILRAQDDAPLFFADLSQIRGNIALNLSAQDSFPWGPWFRPSTGTGVRRSAQIGPIAVNSNPTFDIAPLNTKQFAQGILEPLSKNAFAYYILRGLPPHVILRLMVSGITEVEVKGNQVSIIHSYTAYDQKFNELLDTWASVAYPPKQPARAPKIVSSAEPKDFGPPVFADGKAIVAAVGAGLDANRAGQKVQFTKKNSQVTICMPSDRLGKRFVAVGVVANSVVKGPEGDQVPKSDDACNSGSLERKYSEMPARERVTSATTRYLLRLRSVESIFYYLGEQISDDAPPGAIHHIPFFITTHPTSASRFSVNYREKTYYVGKTIPGVDYTLGILSILNDLLNLHRDANEIPTTKAVQAVGGGS